jgi:putative membrane protein
MELPLSALFTNWDIPPAVSLALALVATLYTIGWTRVRRTRPEQLSRRHLVAFLAGIVSIFVAVSSPLDAFSESLLFMHMGQHYVLMSIAPPLLVLGAPVVPLLRGLPRGLIRNILRPFFRRRLFHAAGSFLTRPVVAWIAMNTAYVGWHIPAAYEFALSSEGWHNLEHACFLFTSILFWWPVIHPWPSRRSWMQLIAVPYLAGADLVNTVVSAFLCFSGKLIYPSYAHVNRPFPINPLTDQIAAGAFMWVLGSVVFLIPVAVIMVHSLSGRVSMGTTRAASSADIIHAEQPAFLQ